MKQKQRVEYFKMKYVFLMLLGLLTSIHVFSQSVQELTNKLALNEKVKNGRFSFYAKNLDTKKVLVDKDKSQRMIPASSLKLLTGYAAIHLFEEDFQFETSVQMTGKIDDQGVLHGDLYVKGGGDPVLGSDYFEKHYDSNNLLNNWANKIAEKGIKEINGRIIADAEIYVDEPMPADWAWEDIGNYYGAGAYGLSFRENKYDIYLNSSSKSGEIVKIDGSSQLIDGLTYECNAVGANINNDQVFVYSPPYAEYATLRGKMPLNKSKFKVKAAMSNPPLTLVKELKSALLIEGVQVNGDATTTRTLYLEEPNGYEAVNLTELFKVKSPRLIDIVNYMHIKSNNLIAEQLVKHLSSVKGNGNGTTDDGLEVIERFLNEIGVGTDGLRQNDGSGLSYTNLVTTEWFVDLLTHMVESNYYKLIKDNLPIAGKSGSMRRVGKGTVIEGKMAAKTGYLNGARSYSGFLSNAIGETIVFSIIANDYSFSASEMRKELSKLLVALY